MLHITNGDAAGSLISKAHVGGYVLPWRDVLHEGPVPSGLTLDESSDVRAGFIEACGWGEAEDVRAEFRMRDERLKRSAEDAEIVLWFEHDLYDQLQLIQLLDWFAQHEAGRTKLSLICINSHEAVADFHGLGQLDIDQLRALFPVRSEVTPEQLALGRRAWAAFTSPDPRQIVSLLAEDTDALPFLRPALRRHLQQFPSRHNSLSRTDAEILRTLDDAGECTLADLFERSQQREEARFLGDWFFVGAYLEPLCLCNVPLVRLNDEDAESECVRGEDFEYKELFSYKYEVFCNSTFEITDAGRDVLRGDRDHVALNGIDLWRGGVHLRPGKPTWRWDADAGSVVSG